MGESTRNGANATSAKRKFDSPRSICNDRRFDQQSVFVVIEIQIDIVYWKRLHATVSRKRHCNPRLIAFSDTCDLARIGSRKRPDPIEMPQTKSDFFVDVLRHAIYLAAALRDQAAYCADDASTDSEPIRTYDGPAKCGRSSLPGTMMARHWCSPSLMIFGR